MDYHKAVECFEALEEMKKILKKGSASEKLLTVVESGFLPILENEFMKQDKRERNVQTMYLDYDPLKELSRAIHCLVNGPKYYEIAVDELRRRENEKQDLLHVLELVEEHEDVLIERARNMKTVLKERRESKDFIELMKPLIDFVGRNQKVVAEIKKVNSEMTRKKENMKLRVYTPKEKTGLEAAFESANKERGLKNE